MPLCPGCGQQFSFTGYSRHLSQTGRPLCQALYQGRFDLEQPLDMEESGSVPGDLDWGNANEVQMDIDEEFFGSGALGVDANASLGVNEGLLGADAEGLLDADAEGLLGADAEGLLGADAEGLLGADAEGLLGTDAEGLLGVDAEAHVPGDMNWNDMDDVQMAIHEGGPSRVEGEDGLRYEDEDGDGDEEGVGGEGVEEEVEEEDNLLVEDFQGGWEPQRTEPEMQVIEPIEDDNGPESQSTRLIAEEQLHHEPVVVEFPDHNAGRPIDNAGASGYHAYKDHVNDPESPWAPFQSRIDWEIARWAKLRGPGSTAFDDLLSIEGVKDSLGLSYSNSKELNKIIDQKLPSERPTFRHKEIIVAGEVFDLHYRDILECVKELFGDPELAEHLILAPERHYVDEDQGIHQYDDMHTGKWWWSMQKLLVKDHPGGTIIPIIISSDKTQVTVFRNKMAYPVYMTLGNIPKHIRRKSSSQAQILLGYIPTTKLEHITNKASRQRALANLFHASLGYILHPLKDAGRTGLLMTSGAGMIYRGFPLFAAFAGDYPEQILATICKTGDCPKCDVDHEEMGEDGESYELRDANRVIDVLESFDPDNILAFTQKCKTVNIKPIANPFWKDLPYVDIFQAITPDILHQGYQGLVKYLLTWIKEAYGAAEIDARCRRLPPNHNIHLFAKGITSLSRLTGQEHNQICCFLLGILIDLPCCDQGISVQLLHAISGALDFLYLAQYQSHTDTTLKLLDDALERFNANKSVLIDLGIRDHFRIMKLHFFKHYSHLIRLFGTTDGYDTQYTERLHIDLAKNAYRATNKKDEYWQMVLWLERKEKILRHAKFVHWQMNGEKDVQSRRVSPTLKPAWKLTMTKHPSAKAVPIEVLMREYGAMHFREAFSRYIVTILHKGITKAELEKKAEDVFLPTRSLPVYHRIKFMDLNTSEVVDSIHVQPKKSIAHNREMQPRFDTALVNDGTGKAIGVKGYRVGQVRVVFSLPNRVKAFFPAQTQAHLSQHLAYVEWFTKFPSKKDSNYGMYKISRSYVGGDRLASIIPVKNIARSIHLFPKFGPVVPPEWTSSNILDKCSIFYVNSYSSKVMFASLI
jgi:hypothetical protein